MFKLNECAKILFFRNNCYIAKRILDHTTMMTTCCFIKKK